VCGSCWCGSKPACGGHLLSSGLLGQSATDEMAQQDKEFVRTWGLLQYKKVEEVMRHGGGRVLQRGEKIRVSQ